MGFLSLFFGTPYLGTQNFCLSEDGQLEVGEADAGVECADAEGDVVTWCVSLGMQLEGACIDAQGQVEWAQEGFEPISGTGCGCHQGDFAIDALPLFEAICQKRKVVFGVAGSELVSASNDILVIKRVVGNGLRGFCLELQRHARDEEFSFLKQALACFVT